MKITEEEFQQLCQEAVSANQSVLLGMRLVQSGKDFRPMSAEELQGWLLTKREAEGLSLRDLTRITGVSPSMLSRIENGYSFDWDTGQAVLRWLSGELQDVQGGNDATTAR